MLQEYENYLAINKSPRTVSCYSSFVKPFLYKYPDPRKVSQGDIVKFMLSYTQYHSRKQVRAALLHLYRMLKLPGRVDNIPYPDKPLVHKQALSLEQVQAMARSIKNHKQRLLFCLAYFCGLRVSELVGLRWSKVSLPQMQIVVHGKGNKERTLPINDRLVEMLVKHRRRSKGTYVFEGQGREKYSTSSAQAVVKNAARAARVFGKVTIHTLRHSRATHLLARGVQLKYISVFLGHNKVTTTETYLHPEVPEMKSAILLAS